MQMLLFLLLGILITPHTSLAKEPVLVAVVDMGIASDRVTAFKPYMVPGWDFGEDHQAVGVDYNDLYGNEYHGTLVAGLILRKVSPHKIKIMDIVYSDYYGKKFKLDEYMYAENMLQVYRRKRAFERFTEHLRDVFRFAKENQAKVINFSSSDSRFYGDELANWIKENPDTILVVSAGNDSDNIDKYPQYPCMYEQVICVGAVNKNKRAKYSNYGSKVTLYAQGSYSKEIEGTSFSAPVISQAVALIKYHHPEWQFKTIKKELLRFTQVKNGIRIFQDNKFKLAYN